MQMVVVGGEIDILSNYAATNTNVPSLTCRPGVLVVVDVLLLGTLRAAGQRGGGVRSVLAHLYLV